MSTTASNRSRALRWFAAFAAVSAMASLTACETAHLHGPYSMGYDGKQLLIATCVDRTFTKVLLLQTSRDVDGSDSDSDSVVWSATGRATMQAGDVLVVGGQNEGLMTAEEAPASVKPGWRFNFVSNSGDREVPTARFDIPDSGLRAGEWLSSNGEVTSSPCEDQ